MAEVSVAAGKQIKYKWTNEEVEKLIDLYEERPCLWDISDTAYSKRDLKEKAFSEIKEELEIDLSIIQAKWKSLRAQYGRERAKENKTKSGQSVDELYESSWTYMQRMKFVEQVPKTAKNRSTLMLTNEESDQELSDSVVSEPDPNKSVNLSKENRRKKRAADANDEKRKLFAKCIDVLDKPRSPKRPLIEDSFALYVANQLKDLDPRQRLIAEKRINDVIFDIKMQDFNTGAAFSGVNYQHSSTPHPIQPLNNNSFEVQRGQYTAMLQDF